MVQDAELCNKFHQQLRGMFSIQKDWLLKQLFKKVKDGNILGFEFENLLLK